MLKNKRFIIYIVMSIIVISIYTIIFIVGVFHNPDFTITDFCMDLASEVLGIVIAVVIVDNYIKMKKEILQRIMESSDVKRASELTESSFEIINGGGIKSMKNVSTLRDKETGILYLFVIHEHGSGLTPLLDKDGKPITDERTGT